MNTTTQITGMLPAVLIISAIFTAIASWLLLSRYKRATLKGMAKVTGADTASSGKKERAPVPSKLHFSMNSTSPVKDPAMQAGYLKAKKGLRALITVYAIAGIAYALLMTLAYMVITGNGFVPGRFLWLIGCFAWPTILTIGIVSPRGPGKLQRSLIVYFVLLFLVVIFTILNSPNITIAQLAFFWVWVNGPTTLLLLTFLRKKIRAVGPLVLAFMVLAVGGAFLAVDVVDSSDRVLKGIAEFGRSFGLGAVVLFMLILIGGYLVLGVVGWMVLKILGARYRKKKLSDQTLTIDSLWLLFGIMQSITLAFEGIAWVLTGPAAFVVYKLIKYIGFKIKGQRPKPGTLVPKLLFLRVFALGRRSERLFDQLSKYWRHAGSISLISGPDLMTSSVEPHEFLDFLGGKHSRQFVMDGKDLDKRLAAMDLEPDPDGRYRINEFFCRTNNWKMTMQKLSQQSDVVLMDLRSFAITNKGCIYELEQLLDLVSLSKITFLIDRTTDESFLKETLQALWQAVHVDSPNLQADQPTVSFFYLQESQHPIKILLSTLMAKH